MWNDVWKPVVLFFGFVATGMALVFSLVALAWWAARAMPWG